MRRRWEPTPEQRETVRTMAAYGIPGSDIARVLGVSYHTMARRCREELDTAASLANARVAQTAYQMATDGQHQAMTMFWLKTRARWREQDRNVIAMAQNAAGDQRVLVVAGGQEIDLMELARPDDPQVAALPYYSSNGTQTAQSDTKHS